MTTQETPHDVDRSNQAVANVVSPQILLYIRQLSNNRSEISDEVVTPCFANDNAFEMSDLQPIDFDKLLLKSQREQRNQFEQNDASNDDRDSCDIDR